MKLRSPTLRSHTIVRVDTRSSNFRSRGNNSPDCTFKQSRQRGICSHDRNYITPANIMLELLRCHSKGTCQDWSSAPLPAEKSIPGVSDTCPIGMGLWQRSQPTSISTLLPNSVSELARVSWGLADDKCWSTKGFIGKNNLQGGSLDTGMTHSTNHLVPLLSKKTCLCLVCRKR